MDINGNPLNMTFYGANINEKHRRFEFIVMPCLSFFENTKGRLRNATPKCQAEPNVTGSEAENALQHSISYMSQPEMIIAYN